MQKLLLALAAAISFGLMVDFIVRADFDLHYLGAVLDHKDLLGILFGLIGCGCAVALDILDEPSPAPCGEVSAA